MAGIITTEAGDGQISANRRLHRRDHSSRAGVYWADRLARAIITVGGIGTIIVVLLVVLVLLANVVPLFRPSHLTDGPLVALASSKDASQELATNSTVLAFGSDEYSEILWLVRPDQSIDVYLVDRVCRWVDLDPPTRTIGVRAFGFNEVDELARCADSRAKNERHFEKDCLKATNT